MTSTVSGRNKCRRRSTTHRAGQINQVFILIVAVIVIVATIALGVRLLGFFQNTSCGVADAGFQEDLSQALDGGSVYGSRDEITLFAPCDAQELILIDSQAMSLQATTPVRTGDQTIDAALAAGVRTNAFVIIDGVAQEVGYDERIIVQRSPTGGLATVPYLKVPSRNGRFTFLTEGFGRFVRVDRVDS